MKTWGLNGIRRSRGIRTTIPSADGIRAGDLQFRAEEPNRVLCEFSRWPSHVGPVASISKALMRWQRSIVRPIAFAASAGSPTTGR